MSLQELLDRQAIRDVVQRYARGIDRHDRDLVASCYLPDALDDHGAYIGPGDGVAEWALASHEAGCRHQNHITNHLVELDGDVAHGETYYLVVSSFDGTTTILASGRYVDRFERRDGEWRIAARVCTIDSISTPPLGDMGDADRRFFPGTRDRTDLSYRRPLEVDRTPTP